MYIYIFIFIFLEGLELCLILEKWRISRCFSSQVLRLPHKVRFVFLFSENGTRKKRISAVLYGEWKRIEVH